MVVAMFSWAMYSALLRKKKFKLSQISLLLVIISAGIILLLPAYLIELALGSEFELTEEISDQIDHLLPIGWAHGERYSDDQWIGIEKFC